MAKAKRKASKKKRGSKYEELIPGIPDTPENIMRALTNTPPKKRDKWEYLKQK